MTANLHHMFSKWCDSRPTFVNNQSSTWSQCSPLTAKMIPVLFKKKKITQGLLASNYNPFLNGKMSAVSSAPVHRFILNNFVCLWTNLVRNEKRSFCLWDRGLSANRRHLEWSGLSFCTNWILYLVTPRSFRKNFPRSTIYLFL